ncbi:MAG: Rrf2 family transcriptional regulator [Rhodospirillaceae bacterium]|nr:Rrf2 family transcriptional regulator [Rhodospirillaceae bacterium]MCA8932100.1 Rrf2 family transcriptional regulator [Rhodospirillaceae bacterium]
MQLRNQVEWALHCCTVLASLPGDGHLSTKAMAEFHGIPKEYLSKALQTLSQAGIVVGTLGPSGGYRLARPADDITVLEIVEAVEGKAPTFVCTEIRRNNPCRPAGYCDDRPCAIARVMAQADQAWRASLAGVRLGDLVRTVAAEVPAEILERGADWVKQRL